MIIIRRSFVEITRKHKTLVSLFCNLGSFRLRIYNRGYVKYTLVLWDRYQSHDIGLWKGHKKIWGKQ